MSQKHEKVEDPSDPFFIRKPPPPFKLSTFLYNSEKGLVLGRSGSSWAKILLFYGVFYAVLAALVAICMWVFFQTLDPRTPKWRLEESLIGTNPGLGFRPLPPPSNVESTLIWYKGTNRKDFKHWTDSLDEFLEVYKTLGKISGQGSNIEECSYKKPPNRGKVCAVKIQTGFGPCTQENNYSYHLNEPCIFLKLNKIYGWRPELYNTTDDLPMKMPQSVRNDINNTLAGPNPDEANKIWVSCEGENPADIEHIGAVKYYPTNGFPYFYFPYENSEGYMSPLVAVHFSKLKRGIIINIECKAWARNIKHDRKDRLGSVHFELMID